MTRLGLVVAVLSIAGAQAAGPGGWSEPVEVRHQETLALTYRAKWDGPYLVIRAAIEPGWHTFSMDNKKRAEEKLAGKKALSVDQPTEFTITGAQVAGGWMQSAPKDFSKPELRMFTWGYEREAVFAAKAAPAGTAGKIAVRGQACTDTICKNIDAEIVVPPARGKAAPLEINLKELVAVR